MTESERDAALYEPDCLLADAPLLRLGTEDAGRFLSGVRRRLNDDNDIGDTPVVRVYGPELRAFLGSGHITAGELISNRLLSPIEVQGLLTPRA